MEGLETIKERLDKALASLPWMDWFVESKVTLYLFIYFFYDSRMSKLRWKNSSSISSRLAANVQGSAPWVDTEAVLLTIEDAINLGLIYVIIWRGLSSFFWSYILRKLSSSSSPREILNLVKDIHGNRYQLEAICLLQDQWIETKVVNTVSVPAPVWSSK